MSKIIRRIKRKVNELISSRYGLAKVMRFEDYANVYDKALYHLLETNRETTVLPCIFLGEQQAVTEPCELPDMYWAKLIDASIIGGSDVVLTDNHKMLYDMLAQCDDYNANMTATGLLLLFGRPHHIGKKYFYSYKTKVGEPIEKGISLASNMSKNYFHFMFQVASKMAYIRDAGIDKDVPLLIDERVLGVPQMKQIVDCLNEEQREIVALESKRAYKVHELYCINNPNIVIPNSKNKALTEKQNNAFAYDTKALDYINTRVFAWTDAGNSFQTYPKRVFLSRKNCNKRQINEDELHPVLKKYGFEFVFTENMSVYEQALLFHGAEHIIGSSGAAFTNLVFCSKNCKVLILMPLRINVTCYSSLGNTMGALMMYLAGSTGHAETHVPYYRVEPEELDYYLQSIYSNQKKN